MRKTIRLKEALELALSDHALLISAGNWTSAIRDVSSLLTGLGPLSFRYADMPDHVDLVIVQLDLTILLFHRVTTIVGEIGFSKYQVYASFTRKQFYQNFVIDGSKFVHRECFNGSVPDGVLDLLDVS